MTPEQIAAITALAAIIERIGAWPLGSFVVLIFFGPLMLSLVNSYFQNRQVKKIEEYYRSNVRLVEAYEKTCTDFGQIATELRDIIVLNTREWSTVKESVGTNQFCPLVRARHTSHRSIQYDTDKPGED